MKQEKNWGYEKHINELDRHIAGWMLVSIIEFFIIIMLVCCVVI